MEEWKELPLSQLKRLVKSRAGRIAELRMEVKVLEGLIEARARSGDFGEGKREEPKRERPPERPEPPAAPGPEPQPRPQAVQAQERPVQAAPDQGVRAQQGQGFAGQRPVLGRSPDAPQVYGSQDNGDEEDEQAARKKKEASTFVEL